jgi:uncharacterized protein YndB with AHSA1/START domain
MAIETHAAIEIAAPPDEVFEWLTEPEKLKAWTGMDPKVMPANPSELKPGYRNKGQFQAPDGMREMEFEVTDYEPPRHFAFVETYKGGKSVVRYDVTESGSGSKVEMKACTDSAAPSTEVPEQVKEQIEQLHGISRWLAKHQMKQVMEQVEHMNVEAMPQVKQAMQAQVDQEFQQLKNLVELVEKERRE